MNESGEMYLKTILFLQERNGMVRSIDVAAELGYSKPSVSRAVSILKEEGYLMVGEKGNLILTDKGLKTAIQIKERYIYVSKFLIDSLDVPEEIALKDACRIEHIISDEIFEKIKKRYES